MDDSKFKELTENNYLTTVYKSDNLIIREICNFKNYDDIRSFVKSFINLKTFPYLHNVYNKLLCASIDDLSASEKAAFVSQLCKYLHEFDSLEAKSLKKLSDDEIIANYSLTPEELIYEKNNDFKSIKGGYLIEILLGNILISLGFSQIISKLYFQWGLLSPTGIDTVFL